MELVQGAESRIIRLDTIKEITGLKKTMLYRLMAEGDFPKSIQLGSRAVGWSFAEVEAWLAERINRPRTRTVTATTKLHTKAT